MGSGIKLRSSWLHGKHFTDWAITRSFWMFWLWVSKKYILSYKSVHRITHAESVCMYTDTHTHICIHAHPHMHTQTHVGMRTHTRMHILAHPGKHTHTHMHTKTHTHMHVCASARERTFHEQLGISIQVRQPLFLFYFILGNTGCHSLYWFQVSLLCLSQQS